MRSWICRSRTWSIRQRNIKTSLGQQPDQSSHTAGPKAIVEFIHNPGIWCMAAGVLHHGITTDGLAELTGSWGPLGIPGGCPPGCFGGAILRRRIADRTRELFIANRA